MKHHVVASIFLAGIIIFAGTAHGAAGSKSSKAAETPKTTPAPTPVVSKHPDLDEQTRKLQDGLEDAKRLLSAAMADVTTAGLAVFGATLGEYEERAKMARSLKYEFERHIESLNRLRKLRDDKPDPNLDIEQLEEFRKKAPFTIDQVDEVRGQIADVKMKIDSIGIRRSFTTSEQERIKGDLKDAGVRARQAAEKLESAKTQSDRARLSWQRDMALLAEKLAQTRLAASEASRNSSEQDLSNQRATLGLLERKLEVAVANAPFTDTEVNDKLNKLREGMRELQAEQEKAAKARDEAAAKLEAAREELRIAKEKLNALPKPPAPIVLGSTGKSSPTVIVPSGTPPVITTAPKPAATPAPDPETIKLVQKVAQLQAVYDLRRDESDTANAIYSLFRVLIYYQDYEQNVWEARFKNPNPNDPKQYKEIQKWLTEGLDKTAQGRNYVQTNVDLTATQLTAAQNRLDQWKPEDGDMRNARGRLSSLQVRADAYRRAVDQVRRTERLLQSWKAEVEDKLSRETWGERLAEVRHNVGVWMHKIWNFELLTAQETIVVDGKPVTTTVRSVTVGKLVSAILILLIGIWFCHRVAARVRWIAIRRFHARDNHARLLYKLIFSTGLLIVLLGTMTALKIPLTIFAFLGGALAIGVGFGAQNLINNFISGLILIFERPIKVGDIVEVDGLRGKVVSIGGRCSCVKRFDGIDILIPNSSFLEKNVVNWTHSDLLLRLTVSVGVAYGSPGREVSKLIMRAVEEHGQVLKDPEPVVILENFGDNSMEFKVYFWIEQRDGVDSRVITSDIRFRIDKLFREADISMAYPQRDVHLEATRPIPVAVVQSEERITPPRAEM